MACKILITIDGDMVVTTCDATLATPQKEKKFAAILLAALDASAVALSKDNCEEYAHLNKLIQPGYLPKRIGELLTPNN